jgi:hypothetical protein
MGWRWIGGYRELLLGFGGCFFLVASCCPCHLEMRTSSRDWAIASRVTLSMRPSLKLYSVFRLLACVCAGKARFLIMYLMPLMPSLLAPFEDANVGRLQFSFITFILIILNRKSFALSRLYDLNLEMCHAVVRECDAFGPDVNIVGQTQNTPSSGLYNQS